MRVSFTKYVDLECLLENISNCHNDPNKSSTIKINKHTPSGYSLLTYCSFDNTKNRLSHYRSKDCMQMLYKELKEHTKSVIYCEKREMISLTDEENESHEDQKFCCIYKKRFTNDNKKEIVVILLENTEGLLITSAILIIKYQISHNGSTYDYHFIIRCLSENTEKYITFSVQINKIIKIDEDGNNKTVNTPYKLKFMDSFRFMSTSLSSLVDNLSDGLHSNKCTNCKSSLDYMKVGNNQLIFKCLHCNKNYDNDFNEELINRFPNIYKFCNGDINKFVLLLRKGVYLYEYMNS